MDNDETRRVIQAARALLRWDAARFGKEVSVAAVTIRRIEAGVPVKAETIATVLARLETIGVRVIVDGPDGVMLGVGLLPHAKVGPPPLAAAHAREGSRQRAPRRPPAEKKSEDDGAG